TSIWSATVHAVASQQLAVDKLEPAEQPRYVQVARALHAAIAQGVLPVGDRLPAERELCRRVSVSPATRRRPPVGPGAQGWRPGDRAARLDRAGGTGLRAGGGHARLVRHRAR